MKMVNLVKEAELFVELFKQMPPLHNLDPQTVRELTAPRPSEPPEMSTLSSIKDQVIPVSQNHSIKIRIYTPEGKGPFPIYIYYHGGGWVIGSIETCDASCRLIAEATQRIVISVDYRLSPEYKFPIPLEDSYTALKWVSENIHIHNGISSNIVVGGDSAGGNLAAAVSMMSRDHNGPKINAQILIYPVTSLSYDTKSYQEFAEGPILSRDLMMWFGNHYIRKESDKKNCYVAPLLAEDLTSLPSALVITAENDVLRDEGLLYAERLRNAGIKVESLCEEGLVHGYFSNTALFQDRIKNTIRRIVEFLT